MLGHDFSNTQCICIYIYIPVTSLGGQLLGLRMYEKQREKSKTRAENNKDEKEEKRLKHEKPHLLGGVFSWPYLTIKQGIFDIFDWESPTQWGYSHIYIYIYIYTCVIVLSPRVFRRGSVALQNGAESGVHCNAFTLAKGEFANRVDQVPL